MGLRGEERRGGETRGFNWKEGFCLWGSRGRALGLAEGQHQQQQQPEEEEEEETGRRGEERLCLIYTVEIVTVRA